MTPHQKRRTLQQNATLNIVQTPWSVSNRLLTRHVLLIKARSTYNIRYKTVQQSIARVCAPPNWLDSSLIRYWLLNQPRAHKPQNDTSWSCWWKNLDTTAMSLRNALAGAKRRLSSKYTCTYVWEWFDDSSFNRLPYMLSNQNYLFLVSIWRNQTELICKLM